MEFLTVSHSYLLIAMSCVVALVASFTGLSPTRNLSPKPVFEKKASVALGSVALGGGIWAMHSVAMLGLKLPVLFYYDAAITLVSALSAILIVGAALIDEQEEPENEAEEAVAEEIEARKEQVTTPDTTLDRDDSIGEEPPA